MAKTVKKPAAKTATKTSTTKKDTFTASLALWLSMGFWLPLFNIGFAAVAIWQGVRAMKLLQLDPERFGGRARAIAAIIIGITTIVLTAAGIIIFGIRQIKCGPLDLSASILGLTTTN